MTATTHAESVTGQDRRQEAFCSQNGMEVFESIAHRNSIWRKDPYDVDSIHEEARTVFQRLVDAAVSPSGTEHGRILLIKGESGSGKTHLMRAFRNYVHGGQLGYCAYQQMTVSTDNYSRYLLSNLIDSLDKPYSEPEFEQSGLMRLSNAAVTGSRAVRPQDLQSLREDTGFYNCARLGEHVAAVADRILAAPGFEELDIDLLRALLFLQRDDSRIKARALKYLRCEELPDYDWKILGRILSREKASDPQRMVEQLGRAISILHQQENSLVLLIDQLEDVFNLEDAGTCFRRAMDAVRQTTDNVPSSIVVISCLNDFYHQFHSYLTRPVLDRVELAPPPIALTALRSLEDIRELISLRLQNLYDSQDVAWDEGDPTYPFPETELKRHTNTRTRDVLSWCHQYREACVLAQRLIEFDDVDHEELSHDHSLEDAPEKDGSSSVGMEQRWNEFRAAWKESPPDDEPGLAELLGWAVAECSQEFEKGWRFLTSADGRFLVVDVNTPGGATERLAVGVCNKGAVGGGLGRQVTELETHASEGIPVIVRCSGFPATPKAKVNLHIGRLIAEKNARKVQATDSDLRTMLAFREFAKQVSDEPSRNSWLRGEQPLSRLATLQQILDMEKLRTRPKPTQADQEESTEPSTPSDSTEQVKPGIDGGSADKEVAPVEVPAGQLRIGDTRGVRSEPVWLDTNTLIRHAAFLGATGSGKTSAALHGIEQLLAQGLPIVLVDRKGDLCRYACPSWWDEAPTAPERLEQKQRLRERIEVHLFTPGNPDGRPLGLTLAPTGLQDLSPHERAQAIRYSASALGSMMGYKQTQRDQARLVILTKALEVAIAESSDGLTLEGVVALVDDMDPALVNAVGRLDTKLYKALVQDLETLRLSRSNLLNAGPETLQAETLFGGKGARLSIISTKFLGDNATIDFWVSRLLVEIARWSSKCPSDALQGVLMLDEADMYMPAVGKPATKEPMAHLLRRARSAGLSVFVATQNPGDLDYRLRENFGTWFLGRITEKNSVKKMDSLLRECRTDVSAKLASQTAGEFFLLRSGDASPIKTKQALMETKQLAEDYILQQARRTFSHPRP